MPNPPPNWLFSALSFISLSFVTVPFYWHLEAWNTGTCLYMGWTAIQLLNLFINSVVFNGHAENVAPVWCDISSRIFVGASVAIPAASLCINRRLYHIASIKTVTKTKAEKRRDIMIDLMIGLGIPLLQMCLQYIVQGHRFNIFEDVGCYPFTWNVTPAYPLTFCWPLAISVVSASYCIRTLRCFAKRRREFNEILSSNRNLTQSRYFRLMCLSGVELVFGIPLSSYSIYLNITGSPIHRWVSWENTHWGFSRVDQFPSILWHNEPTLAASLELSRWLTIFCACIFFAFFGFADEARKHYRLAFTSVAKRVGYSGTTLGASGAIASSGFTGSVSKPRAMYNSNNKRDSFGSFSDKLDSIYINDLGGTILDEKTVGEFSATNTTNASSPSLVTPEDRSTADNRFPSPPALSRPEPTLDLSILQRNSTGSEPSSPV
ncbi:hypothetical protein JAAARDRAFT_141773 [Jaapia argillacea MUCL 33604]|uniref:STE3-domain-containing protein n=1 Tax=Jaapia argillacea MUCL 33604 TaxID=933084 RepID=A0A067P732_9AGAM|nr:hypothetical protein JAAARDRAFT_141773 [Jaapia argillacea MUCL 33604]